MEQKIIELLKEKKEDVAIQLYKNTFDVSLEEAQEAVEVMKDESCADILVSGGYGMPNHRSDSAFSQGEINSILYHLAYGEENSILMYFQSKYGIDKKEAYHIMDSLYDETMPYLASFDRFNLQAILELLHKNRKIAAIRLYKKIYPTDFIGAKQMVDRLNYLFK